jgi:hypothetical protein
MQAIPKAEPLRKETKLTLLIKKVQQAELMLPLVPVLLNQKVEQVMFMRIIHQEQE